MPPKKKVVAKKAAVTGEKVDSESSTGANIFNGEDEPIGTERDKVRNNVENSADVLAKKRARTNDVESHEPVKKKGRPEKEPEMENEKSKEPPKAKGGKQKKEPEGKEKIKNGEPNEPPQKRGRQKKEPEVKEEIKNEEPSGPPQKRGRQKQETEVKEEIKNGEPSRPPQKIGRPKKEPEVEEDMENGGAEEPPKKRGRSKKATEETEHVEADNRKKKSNKKTKKIDKTGHTAKNDNLVVHPISPVTKRRKQIKEPEKKNTKQSEKKETTKESSDDSSKQTKWNEINFNCSNTNVAGEEYNFKITSWNVDGLRAWLKKGGLKIIDHLSPDILCLQETKCTSSQIPDITDFEGYENFWCSSKKNGYAGVGVLSKEKPINVTYGIGNEEQDEDGRCITAEFEKFFLVTVYVPNAGRKLVTLDKRLKWNDIFKNFIKDLDKRKPVIICGDMNVAHGEIDLANPKTNTKNAGFTKEERDGLTNFLNGGYVDTFRVLYPEKKDSYTFWTYMNNARGRNIGWRLDYFIVSQRFQKNICDNVIHDKVFGSDHCPLTLFMNV